MKKFASLFFYFIITTCQIYSQIDNSLSEQSFKKHLKILGSDLFEGRGTGSTGGYLAANYLAQEFAKMNLNPVGLNDTYYQYIPMHSAKPLVDSKLIIYNNGEQKQLILKKDYFLYKSGDQTFLPSAVDLVFAGYGIIAPEYDYNDYQSIDVQGKIVVLLDGEPDSKDENYFEGFTPTIYSYPESKIRLAISRGASGTIIIPNPKKNKHSNWSNFQKQFAFDDVTLAYSVTGNLGILFNPEVAQNLFLNSPFTFDEVLELDIKNKIKSFELKSKLSFKGEFKRNDFVSPNVVGLLEGSDPEKKDEYLIISAHYDHLGIGPVIKGDSIYNGVFDNAAGVSALLNIASALSQQKEKINRSVIFLLVTGEEKGLLGSIYYNDHPVKPLYKTIANINIDGIASFGEFTSIIGIGKKYSTLDEFLEKSARINNLNVVPIPPIFKQSEAFNRSDQIAFANAGIPSILVLDAPYYKNMSNEEAINRIINYQTNIYHTPFDDLSQPINYKAVMQHIDLLFDLSMLILNNDKIPEWKETSPYINNRLRSKAEKR